MTASSSSKRLLLPLIALAGLGAQDPRQAAKFAGKSIPDPPRQKDPWTPPRTKLPRFLVTATTALFEQGVADPRGCEYREVEIVDGADLQDPGLRPPRAAGRARPVRRDLGRRDRSGLVGRPRGRPGRGHPRPGRLDETRRRERRGREGGSNAGRAAGFVGHVLGAAAWFGPGGAVGRR